MLNLSPKSETILSFDQTCMAFQQAYDEMTVPVALCDGLEIVIRNPAFSDLFDLEYTANEVVYLNTLIEDQDSIETLFAHPKTPIDISRPYEMTLTAHPWAVFPEYWLLNIESRERIERLRKQLRLAQSQEVASGTLFPTAFKAQLQLLLNHLKRVNECGLLCEIKFGAPQNRLSGLSVEERNTLIGNFAERLRIEFGQKTLLTRTDTLTLMCFFSSSSAESETRNTLNQVKRLGVRSISEVSNKLTLKCGAAAYPAHAKTLSGLFRSCSLAVQTASLLDMGNGNQTQLFTREIDKSDTRRLTLAKEMRAAISTGDIAPHFQPIIDAKNGTILSFEALIRWHHPKLGNVTPPEIVALAEENDLLNFLTESTMQTVAEQAKSWPESVQFAVNATPAQMNSVLVDIVRRTVRNAHLDPRRLEIEVTEDALITDFEASAKTFTRLRAIGVTIAMDDFGAGYTSIGNLRRLEFNKLKIDKSIADGLPSDQRSTAIVRSLISMANELGVSVVVEGIEHETQLWFLRAFNCGIQGYIYSPPVPASQLKELKRFLPPGPKAKEYLIRSS